MNYLGILIPEARKCLNIKDIFHTDPTDLS
jgi:hypothetical protein